MPIVNDNKEIDTIEVKRLVKLGVPIDQAERFTLGEFLEFWRWAHHCQLDRLIFPYDYQGPSLGSARLQSMKLNGVKFS